MDEVTFIPPGVDEDAVETIRKYQDQAKQLVQQSLQLFVEPKDEADVMSLLRASHANLDIADPVVEGLARTYDIAVYDVKSSGESVTHPHLRVMSFRTEHYAKLVRGFLRSKLPEGNDTLDKDNYPESALVATLDGGKHLGEPNRKTHQPSM